MHAGNDLFCTFAQIANHGILRVVKIDSEKQLILVEGAIPGSRGGLVYITQAKQQKKS